MNENYKIFPNRDFRDNWGYFNSVFKSEVAYNYMMPIEKIITNDEIDAYEKINQITEIIITFSKKKEKMYKWRDEILEKFIHSRV